MTTLRIVEDNNSEKKFDFILAEHIKKTWDKR